MARERELKFSLTEIPAPKTVQDALTEAGFTVRPLGTQVQNDTYFDTVERTLEHAGLALRVREMLQERFATLKVAGKVKEGFHDREELELPLQNDDWPEPIRERLEGMDTDFLKPTLALRNERTRYLILENKTELAELSLDKVKARRPGEEREVHFLELEVEACAGSDEDLQRIAGVLKRFLTLTPQSLSKPRHAEALLGIIGIE